MAQLGCGLDPLRRTAQASRAGDLDSRHVRDDGVLLLGLEFEKVGEEEELFSLGRS